jgi:tRNA U34 5-methylaminomethyl-2-thiouridine-forming methyltransferase MnmC
MEKLPARHQLVITKDQSLSLFNETFQENLHSTEGAISETIYNFIEGCELLNHKGPVLSVLEVGFGTGLGFFETLKFLRKFFPEKKLMFYSLEIDRDLALWALRDLPFTQNSNFLESCGPDYYLRVILGEATKSLEDIKIGPFDAIYHDPFSPKKNPTLWTKEWFAKLLSLAGPKCILSTYSAATSIRLALLKAGWGVFDRKGFSFKRSSTIAKPYEETPAEIKSKLLSSDIHLI